MSVATDDKRSLPKTNKRKPYVPPALRKAGNVRDLTMGGTPGVGDSLGQQPTYPF